MPIGHAYPAMKSDVNGDRRLTIRSACYICFRVSCSCNNPWAVSGGTPHHEPVFRCEENQALSKKEILGGVVHDLPADLKKALTSNTKALETWEDITPLARNEWICWIESAKKAETRTRRIEWGCSSLKDGKRRPCCWPGCPHR
jgi:Bacteriocin-protection, YdeI or OmpD-Associated